MAKAAVRSCFASARFPYPPPFAFSSSMRSLAFTFAACSSLAPVQFHIRSSDPADLTRFI
eukprot:CAMPEP_0181216862 /NCGR_PEP_ID=MMETSP1096-20121128/26826_2 /TAXON_ID=156174 ORGANISM="Chrysochromulina ericina, Strain CCMP281" /NCGR_SAMPLE_ID=MMETSP1096 /ASSEMBLY_ACC=CAM_ASM_000453 /LENGTH=59 /DNA_ID=CAMNT_0023308919 /DNA_START=332 /DNA_END=511 /DNA_ORIENTATION=-